MKFFQCPVCGMWCKQKHGPGAPRKYCGDKCYKTTHPAVQRRYEKRNKRQPRSIW